MRHVDKTSAELAAVLNNMGELQCEMQDWSGARESLSEARELLNAQHNRYPKRLEYQLNLAKCMTSLALVELQTGRVDAAAKLNEQSVEMFDSLLQSHPESSNLRYERAKAANSLAKLWMQTSKEPEATALLTSTKAQLEKDMVKWPQASELKEILFYVDTNLASLVAQSSPALAMELYQAAVEIQTQICQVDTRVRPSADLALAFTNLGRAYARQDNPAAARTAYEKAREINDLLRQLAPSNSEFMRNASINLNNLGMAQRRAGDSRAAELHFKDAIAILDKLCQASPDNAGLQHELGGAYNNLANLFEKTGQSDKVDEHYRLAIEHQSRAHELAPSISTYRKFLDNHLFNYGHWLTETNRIDLALETVKQRQDLWPADDPQQVVIASQLVEAADELAVDKRRQAVAERFRTAAKRVLQMAQDAKPSVQ